MKQVIIAFFMLFLSLPFPISAFDGQSIQTQIDALPVTGGTVTLHAGEYVLSQPNGNLEYYPDGTPIRTAILINKDHVTLEGHGSDTIFILAPHTKMRAISIASNNVIIRNLVIDGNKSQRNGTVPWPDGDVVDGLLYANGTAQNITYDNLEVRNGLEDGMGFWKSHDVIVSNNYSHDNGIPVAPGAGLSVSGAINATIQNNRFEHNTAVGIWSAFDANNVKILNNTIVGNASGGITIGDSTYGLGPANTGFEIRQNIFSENGASGFATITVYASQNGIIEHNRIDTSAYDNFQIMGTEAIKSMNWTIRNNVCNGPIGINAVSNYQGVTLQSNLCQTNLAQQTLPGDLDLNGSVDIFDYNTIVGDLGKTGSQGFSPADINLSDTVDIFDYNILIGNFGQPAS